MDRDLIVRRPRWLSAGECHEWAYDHDWVREHRDNLIGRASVDRMERYITGATRSEDGERIDPEGFISPFVLRRFSDYMAVHRRQADGQLRASDNWQKGMPKDRYLKSLLRHVMDLWIAWRGGSADESMEDLLCACLFNVQGMLHEMLRDRAYRGLPHLANRPEAE
jgi:hypothetical protein